MIRYYDAHIGILEDKMSRATTGTARAKYKAEMQDYIEMRRARIALQESE